MSCLDDLAQALALGIGKLHESARVPPTGSMPSP
jgi:hypothetical protein